jgi:hypothetical protein
MSILAYIEVHSASEPQENDLLMLAVDSAIYLAMEGTDPNAGIFRSEEDVREFVEAKFPAVKKRASIDVSKRLARLSSKTGTPRIRHHQKDGGYCLPYEVRSDFSERSIFIRNLEVSFWDSVKRRARESAALTDDECNAVAEVTSYAINKTFEKQGLNLMASLNGAITYEDIKTYEYIREKTIDLIPDMARRMEINTVTANVIRSVFYSGTAEEKEYLFKLFKAFSIEFVIRGDDKVGSYFNQLAHSLSLIVGSDILVRALSEACVRPENQATQNTLRMLARAGATLFLTEQVFDEVYGNIHAADLEFENHYRPWEKMATLAETQQSDRILIRAYFYSKLEPQRHAKSCSNWEQFLALFGEPRWFRAEDGKDTFAAFLQRKFDLKFISASDIHSAVNRSKANALKDKVQQYKKNDRLARNDAYLALYVEERRRSQGEVMGDSVYGFRTWWLTEEFNILEAARGLGVRYNLNMHPQFIMNLYAASPGLNSLTKTFEGIFPTNFGLRVTDRVSPSVMTRFLTDAVTAVNADEAVAAAKIRGRANSLLGVRFN